MNVGQSIRLYVAFEQLKRASVRLEAVNRTVRVEPLEVDRRHTDVRAAIEDQRPVIRARKPILAANEYLPEQEMQGLIVKRLDPKPENSFLANADERSCQHQLERQAPVREENPSPRQRSVRTPEEVGAINRRPRDHSERAHLTNLGAAHSGYMGASHSQACAAASMPDAPRRDFDLAVWHVRNSPTGARRVVVHAASRPQGERVAGAS